MGLKPDGVSFVKKTLPIFFLIDVSGSMCGSRIQAVNEAMKRVVPELKKVADGEPDLRFTVRVITYGDGKANWKVGSKNQGEEVENYDWIEIFDGEVNGGTPADKALERVLETMGRNYKEYLGSRIAVPLVFMISDGESNGRMPFNEAVSKFESDPLGKLSTRVAVGIDTENNERAASELQLFAVNGFRHQTSQDIEELVWLIQTATIKSLTRSIKVSIKKETKDEKTQDVFDDIF